MFCKNCGKQIDDGSKFCRYCGNRQENITKPVNANQPIINENTISRLEKIFGISISKKIIALYLIWFLINLIIWLINYQYNNDKENFWPFSKYSEIEDYDITEFIVYTIIPLIVLFIANLLKSNSILNKVDRSNLYDLNFEPDYLPTIIGTLVAIITFVIAISGGIKSESSEGETKAILSLISFIYRIFATIWCVDIAKKLNRDVVGWGWLTFFFPSIALIIIGTKRKLIK